MCERPRNEIEILHDQREILTSLCVHYRTERKLFTHQTLLTTPFGLMLKILPSMSDVVGLLPA